MDPLVLKAGEKSPVTGDCHAGIRGSRGARIPPATRPQFSHAGDGAIRTGLRFDPSCDQELREIGTLVMIHHGCEDLSETVLVLVASDSYRMTRDPTKEPCRHRASMTARRSLVIWLVAETPP